MVLVGENGSKKIMCAAQIACHAASAHGITELNMMDHDMVQQTAADLRSLLVTIFDIFFCFLFGDVVSNVMQSIFLMGVDMILRMAPSYHSGTRSLPVQK